MAKVTARRKRAIIPGNSGNNRVLAWVLVIMSFLMGAISFSTLPVLDTLNTWQSSLNGQMTLQIRAIEGVDSEQQLASAEQVLSQFPGISGYFRISDEQTRQLLEPWLSSDLSSLDLPIPALIGIEVSKEETIDVKALVEQLNKTTAGAFLDDHRNYYGHARQVYWGVFLGLISLQGIFIILILLVVALSSKGAMNANTHIVEVLCQLGARDRFIANEFQQQYLLISLRSSAFGVAASLTLSLFIDIPFAQLSGLNADLFQLSVASRMLLSLPIALFIIFMTTLVTTGACRWTVYRFLS